MNAIDEAAALLEGQVWRNAPLGALTTCRVGGPAALLFEVKSLEDLSAAARAVVATGVPVLVLGRGSNVLVADAGFGGLVVRLVEGFDAIELEGTRVRAGAAVSFPVLARRTAAAGLRGLEWAVGVPGSVGGAVCMNAGCHGSETAEWLARVALVDLAVDPGSPGGGNGQEAWGHQGVSEMTAADLDLAYRHSALTATQVVVGAELVLEPGDTATSSARIVEIVRWRREHQPGGSNAGSVFTNPPGDSAGRLIEAAGLKGLRRGSASVSVKHANFFQADEGGSADDLRALILEVQQRVEERLGVHLVPELRMVGFADPLPAQLPSG